jgi:hypothetical protein
MICQKEYDSWRYYIYYMTKMIRNRNFNQILKSLGFPLLLYIVRGSYYYCNYVLSGCGTSGVFARATDISSMICNKSSMFVDRRRHEVPIQREVLEFQILLRLIVNIWCRLTALTQDVYNCCPIHSGRRLMIQVLDNWWGMKTGELWEKNSKNRREPTRLHNHLCDISLY